MTRPVDSDLLSNRGLAAASSDVVAVLREAGRTGVGLLRLEVHSVCYGARLFTVAGELSALGTGSFASDSGESVAAYQFSFGANGGPFSVRVDEALDQLIRRGNIESRRDGSIEAEPLLWLSSGSESDVGADDGLNLADICAEDSASAWVVAFFECLLFMPFAQLLQGIYHEPRLSACRLTRSRGLLLDESHADDLGRELREASKTMNTPDASPSELRPVLVHHFLRLWLATQAVSAQSGSSE